MGRVSLAAVAVLVVLPLSAARPQEQLGSVHFATSCRPDVAVTFDRAIALLHSFEFGESLRAFEGVLATDSTCAMAWWGIALSRWTNPMATGNRPISQLRQGAEAARHASRLGATASERERAYIAAVRLLFDEFDTREQRARVVAYSDAMGALARRFPADTEATIFYALSLTAAAPPTDKTYAGQLKAGSILEPLWAAQPNHPGLAHYIIHTYDVPALADKARAAAERYSGIAPSAAHALHMPSHTFTRVGLWQESVETNRRSMRVALESGSISEALHASDYAMYAYLQLGEEAEAKAILDGLPALARRFDPAAITGAATGAAGAFALAAIPARWVLERGAWSEAAGLEPRTTAWPYAEAMTWFARALGAAHTRDLSGAEEAIDSLGSIQHRLTAEGETYWAGQVAIQQLGARAWLELARGNEAEALARMREAAAREDSTEKSAVTPGPLAPARELLGDMLLELGRPAEARAEYRAVLRREPNRRHSMRGLRG